MKRSGFVLVAAVLLVAGCRSSFGYTSGEFETLAADMAAQREEIESVLDDALGSYDLLGVRASVRLCEPLSEWSSSTRLVVRPTSGDPAEGVSAIVGCWRRAGFLWRPEM